MKLTSLAVLFIIIISPFLTISDIQVRALHKDRELRAYYDQVVDNAVQDAVFMLSRYRRQKSERKMTLQNIREMAVADMLDSLYYAFGVYGDETGMLRIKGRVPVILFLEYDGYVIHAMNEYPGSDGYTVMDYCWYPKKPYSGESDSDTCFIRYTLEDRVFIYDRSNGLEREGLYSDFKDLVPAFQTREGFEAARLAAVTQAIEKDLASHIARFNSFSARMGMTYSFRFPRIDDADWARALTDEGMLVFAQGFPVIAGKPYECNAFGGARILRKPELVGYEHDGKPTYCRESCGHYLNLSHKPGFDSDSIVHFIDAREAASEGYYPCGFCRP